jgi:putative transposase
MFIAERFISRLIHNHGPHPVSIAAGTWYPHQAYRFLNLNHHLHSFYQKSIIERTIQYIKDRTEYFDDYFPCCKRNASK